MTEIPQVRETWRPCYRIAPSRFPPINLFERVADPADWEAVAAIEGLTNDRLREELGDISLVPPEDRISGPGATPIMAAFTHPLPYPTRFSDGSYGVYYASRAEDTAIYETVYHRERFLRYSRERPMKLEMRCYIATLHGEFHDIRAERFLSLDCYHRSEYHAGQALGRQLRAHRSYGVLFRSVRHDGGECVAVFRPPALSPAKQGTHFEYWWDGQRITQVREVSGTRRAGRQRYLADSDVIV